MAKTIKFNLICDDKPVRTIEDLQNNFSVEDVLYYYNNGLLRRWLKVRGYDKEAEEVASITEETPIEIVKKLIGIFKVESDAKKVEENVYILQYLEERKKLCDIYEKQNFKTKEIIDDYRAGYIQLVDDMLKNPDDMNKIKTDIAGIVADYSWILELDHRRLFYLLKETSPLAIMCLLMNDKSRNYYLPVLMSVADNSVEVSAASNSSEDTGDPIVVKVAIEGEMYDIIIEYNYDTETNRDKGKMYDIICSMIKSSDFDAKLGDKLHSFAGITDGYWKDLESKGKKFMIISMGDGDYVRSAGVQGGDLSSADITNKFVIVDGIDYKSNSSTRKLLYMEV